jgi:hypothetical protein
MSAGTSQLDLGIPSHSPRSRCAGRATLRAMSSDGGPRALVKPRNAPAGFAFALQSVGVDWIGQLGFSNAIAAVTQ